MEIIKIYPSKHTKDKSTLNKTIKIVNESQLDLNLNIPLAYVNLDYSKYIMNKRIENDFLKNDANSNIAMTPLIPGQIIDEPESIIFNKYEEQVSLGSLCKEIKGVKYFIPQYEFIPYKFSYTVTVKKNMSYNPGNKYKINVACYDDKDSLDLSSRLSQIFVAPNSSGMEKTNTIIINDNKKSLDSLLNMSFDDADFAFFETFDGKILSENEEEELDVERFLNEHVNVWVGCDTHHFYKHKHDELGYLTFSGSGVYTDFQFKNPILFKNATIKSDVFFNLNWHEYSSQPGKIIHNLFKTTKYESHNLSPVLIIEHVGKGFEIISHNSVLKDPVKYKELIYEVMMYVYLLTYKRSSAVEEYITYTVPDYEVINNKLCTKTNFASKHTLDEMLGLKYKDYSLYQINIYDNNDKELPRSSDSNANRTQIELLDVANNRPIFKLVSSDIYTEVSKPSPNWVSIYKDGKIYYIDQLYYYIESNITDKLFVIENDTSLIVKLYPFKSSKYSINMDLDKMVEIKDFKVDNNNMLKAVNETYFIYINKEDGSLNYTIKSTYEDKKTNIKLAEIEIKQDTNTDVFLTDMRQLGGGLIEEAKDDYDLLDIGHSNGRPYRKSNTLIITMPKKYEQYKDKILQALDKYKVGEDYPVLFFEDEE